MLRFAIILAAMPVMAEAQTSQMLASIDRDLRRIGIRCDVSKLSNAQAAELYTMLRASPERGAGGLSRSRQRARNILQDSC